MGDPMGDPMASTCLRLGPRLFETPVAVVNPLLFVGIRNFGKYYFVDCVDL